MRLKSSKEYLALIGNQTRTVTQIKLLNEIERVEAESKKKSNPLVAKRHVALSSVMPNFSSLPPVEPSDQLYQRLVREWGRFHNGGEVVWEMEAIPRLKIKSRCVLPKL